MKSNDRNAYIQRYTNRLKEFGYSPKTLGWGKSGRQEVRFFVLSEPILCYPQGSVLDVGCGFADLYDYLVGYGWKGEYQGIDIVPDLVNVARQRHPDLEIHEADISNYAASDVESFDFVVASGIFNAKLQDEDNLDHIEYSVTRMFQLSRVALCVDFMSTFVDFKDPAGWHTDPAWAISLAHKLGGRFCIRHDYMPFEFSLIIYKDNSRSLRNVFNAIEVNVNKNGHPKNSFQENEQQHES